MDTRSFLQQLTSIATALTSTAVVWLVTTTSANSERLARIEENLKLYQISNSSNAITGLEVRVSQLEKEAGYRREDNKNNARP